MKKIALFAVFLLAISCNETNHVVAPFVSRVSLTVGNLPPVENAHYALWGTFFNFSNSNGGDGPQHEGEFELFGEFTVMPDGSLRNWNTGNVLFAVPEGRDPQLLKDIVVTIQSGHHHTLAKASEDEPGPVIMGGAFYGTESHAYADLSMSYADAFKSNFSLVTGRATIVCPTSPLDTNSGVWFVEPGPPYSAGIRNLPALPSGWRYQGWVMRPDIVTGIFTYWSTGRFSRADSADFDGAGPNSGLAPPLNFPGQDFVQGSTVFTNLRSGEYSFMVTIEPVPDNSHDPFFLKLLTSGANAPVGRTYTMQNVIATSAPTGRVVIIR